jgi:hypothetical protein
VSSSEAANKLADLHRRLSKLVDSK